MGKKLNIYNLAEIGVDVSASAVHRKFGTLTKAQNAVMLPNEGEGAIEKRGGLTPLGSPVALGAIWGIANVAVNLIQTERLWVGYENTTTAGATWTYTTDGTNWTNSSVPAASFQAQRRNGAYRNVFLAARGAAIRNRMLYPSNDYIIYAVAGHSAPPLRQFNGTDDYLHGKVPFNQQIQIAAGLTETNVECVQGIIKFQGLYYFCSFDDTATRRGTVWSMNPFDGQMIRIGNPFAGSAFAVAPESNRGAPFALAPWNSRLWAITNNYAGGSTSGVYRIRPGVDGAWVKDAEFASTYGTGLLSCLGYLWATLHFDAGTTPKCIYQRTSDGVWTARDTYVHAGSGGTSKPFFFDNKIFYFRGLANLVPSQLLIRASTDGITFADDITDANLFALTGYHLDDSRIGGIHTFKGNLYIILTGTEPTTSGQILKRVPGASPGTWSVVKSAAAGFTGYGAVITTLA
jgi:hypothetical protein